LGVGGRKRIKRESKRENIDVKSNETNENPIHFKEVDGIRFVEKLITD
jgi:hypothetical protein